MTRQMSNSLTVGIVSAQCQTAVLGVVVKCGNGTIMAHGTVFGSVDQPLGTNDDCLELTLIYLTLETTLVTGEGFSDISCRSLSTTRFTVSMGKGQTEKWTCIQTYS